MALPADRRQQIANIVKERRKITCGEICEQFGVSAGTVRKDLEALEGLGCLKRTYGGAVLSEMDSERSIRVGEREVINAWVKDSLGARAAQLIQDDDTIYIDASTTSFFVTKYLHGRKNLTVITNAERVVMELCDREGIRVICTGGVLRKGNLSYVGETAESLIRSGFFADKMFFSCSGISPYFGVFDAVESEANMKKAMFASTRETVLLCDSSKFNKLGFPKLADFGMLNYLVTDQQPGEEWNHVLETNRVQVLLADVFGEGETQ